MEIILLNLPDVTLINLILWLCWSEKTIFPVFVSIATPFGELNFACNAGPSRKAAVPVPAIVETSPFLVFWIK